MTDHQQHCFLLNIEANTQVLAMDRNHESVVVRFDSKEQLLLKGRMYSLSPFLFFFRIFNEMQTSTRTTITRSTTITTRAPSPAPRYTKQEISPSVQPYGSKVGEELAVVLETLEVWTGLCVSTGLCVTVVTETDGSEVVLTTLVGVL